MDAYEQQIKHYENKIRTCATMTELLVAMSSWQSFAQSHGLSEQQMKTVNEAYVEIETKLITQVKKTPWE